MRKSINGLSIIVEAKMELNLFEKAIFVFINRSKTIIKILAWERNGFVLWQKRLEQDFFPWPDIKAQASTITLTVQQLNWIIDGIDITKIAPHKNLDYQTVL